MTGDGELLLDTGVLVAALHADDRNHGRCVQALQVFHGTLLTTEFTVYRVGRRKRFVLVPD